MNDQEEYIEAYLNDKLANAEREQFEQRCKEDEVFAQEVAFYVISKRAIRQDLLEDKKRQWANYEQDKKGRSFKLLTFKKWLPYVAAACLILFVSLYFFNSSSTPHQLATKYFNEHLMLVSQTMNASTDSLQKGIAAYNNKNYETALALFENFRRSHPEQTEVIIYIGNVYLARKNYDSALKYFDELSIIKGKYSSPGMFLKAVTLLIRNEEGDEAHAKELLEQVVIKKEEGSKTAEEWLKKMEIKTIKTLPLIFNNKTVYHEK